MQKLTVKELIEELTKEDQEAIVAIENNGYPYTTTQLNTEGWLAGSYLMKKEPRIQKEYFIDDEIPENQKANYIKVLVFCQLLWLTARLF